MDLTENTNLLLVEVLDYHCQYINWPISASDASLYKETLFSYVPKVP